MNTDKPLSEEEIRAYIKQVIQAIRKDPTFGDTRQKPFYIPNILLEALKKAGIL